jgi:branched-chain amino acid transport system ATP-binding protein
MASMTSLLEVRQLTVQFGGVTALTDVDVTVDRGTIHGLIGPNGAGKTTLFNAISRAVRPQAGTITFDNEDLLRVPARRLIEVGISRTFQNLVLLSELSVLDNVIVGLHSSRYATLLDELLLVSRRSGRRAEAERKARQMLSRFALTAWADSLVSELSYGMRKNIELARACVSMPKLLMLDEPTAGLNSVEMEHLKDALLRLRDEAGLTILVISHHVEFLQGLADTTTVLDLGMAIARGSPLEIRADAKVIKAYLGQQT